MIETAKRNDVEPLAYLSDILTKIVNGHSNSQIDDLLPWAYTANPELKAVASEHRLHFTIDSLNAGFALDEAGGNEIT